MAQDSADEQLAAGLAPSWRDRAVARSLDSARARSEDRVQRFLDAALELMGEGDGREFTVQEVVERSGQSLRSFYQYFRGKHELLLALFEESVRATADELAERIAEEADPVERLHRFVVEYYRMCRPRASRRSRRSPEPRMLADFAQQLLTAHPHEASRAFAPLVTLFGDIFDQAVEAGGLRHGVDRRTVAGTLLEVVMFNAFSATIGGAPAEQDATEAAEQLWDLVFHGIGAR